MISSNSLKDRRLKKDGTGSERELLKLNNVIIFELSQEVEVMKKIIITLFVLLVISLVVVGPASARDRHYRNHHRFGVFIAPPVIVPPVVYRPYYRPYYPPYYYDHYGYREWVPDHWEERWTPYGWERVWVPGYWHYGP